MTLLILVSGSGKPFEGISIRIIHARRRELYAYLFSLVNLPDFDTREQEQKLDLCFYVIAQHYARVLNLTSERDGFCYAILVPHAICVQR